VVVLDPGGASRSAVVDERGRFQFDRVDAGRHALRTSWVGYEPEDRTLDVPGSGITIEIVLSPLPFRLDTLTIVARRTGVFGTVVARPELRQLGNANLTVLATRFRTRTGNDGRFAFGQLTEGAYVVRAQRTGYATRLLPFAVPPTEAVEVTVLMDSISDRSTALRERLYNDLEYRINRRSTPNSAIVAAQELAARRTMSLDLALRYSPAFMRRGLTIEGEECVFVNGQIAGGMRLKDFVAADVEMVEVYATGGGNAGMSVAQARSSHEAGCGYWVTAERFEAGSGRGAFTIIARPRPGLVSLVYVWLKR
jgi:hypothetical protein